MRGLIDAATLGDSMPILLALVLPPSIQLDQGEVIGSVSVHFIGAHVAKDRLGAVLAGRFEQIDGSAGVDVEIEQRYVFGLVVRWLSRAVDNQIESMAAEEFIDCLTVADI